MSSLKKSPRKRLDTSKYEGQLRFLGSGAIEAVVRESGVVNKLDDRTFHPPFAEWRARYWVMRKKRHYTLADRNVSVIRSETV